MSEQDSLPLETKDVRVDPDVASAFAEFMGAFEAYKETNDRRLDEIERRAAADVVTTEKLERLDAALDGYKRRVDALVLKESRPPLHGGVSASPTRADEHKAAFASYVRGGHERGLKDLERKAVTAGSDDAGFLVPDEIEREVAMRLAAISPIRQIATVQQVSSGSYKRPFSIAGPAANWAAEATARSETTAPTLQELAFPAHELYAMPAASQTLLEDSAVDIDRWLAGEIEVAFAEKESAAFVSGDGTDRPRGFASYPKVSEAGWVWGTLGFVPTGAVGGFPASDAPAGVSAADPLVDLVYALKAGYRQNATFVMNKKTQAAVRKLKDADGNHLWQPPASPGAQASLLNFPVVENEEMEDVADNAHPIAFGDFRRGYLIVDRAGIRILRDPYSAKPYVLFYTTKRVGGGVQDFEAIKFLKLSS